GHVRDAHNVREGLRESRCGKGLGDRHVVEGRHAGWSHRVKVERQLLEDEGREAGLVLVVERDALDAPSPPLHVLYVGHFCAPFDWPRISAVFASRRRVISALMRTVKSTGFSPGSARMGSPMMTPTGNLPRLGQLVPRGCAMWTPTSATGMHGTSHELARAAAPGLNWPKLPFFDRVPSGNTSSGIPRSSSAFALTERMPPAVRCTGNALKNSAV